MGYGRLVLLVLYDQAYQLYVGHTNVVLNEADPKKLHKYPESNILILLPGSNLLFLRHQRKI